MRGVLPGRPQSKLQAFDTASWNGERIVAYISGSAFVLLAGPNNLLQTIIPTEDDDELHAITVDPASGKIAVSTKAKVYVFVPLDHGYGAQAVWLLQNTFYNSDEQNSTTYLSWGLPGELLVGASYLTLLSTGDELKELWKSKKLANTTKYAAFSHDASLIASTGWRDRLVKIWRRLFLGGGNEKFDTAYLSHPSTVTTIRWRCRPKQDQHCDSLLFTTCADHHLRVWSASDHHCLQILSLWTDLDLITSIQPRSPLSPSSVKHRYVVLLSQWDFQAAVDQICKHPDVEERRRHAREHLREIASHDPEICIVFDDKGNMSAWGLERVGCKVRDENDITNIAHAENLRLNLQYTPSSEQCYSHCISFAGEDGRINILIHFFDGRLEWLSSDIDNLLDPSPKPGCLSTEAALTGHAETVGSLIRSADGDTLISTSTGREAIAWSLENNIWRRESVITLPEPALFVRILDPSHLVAFMHEFSISIWDISDAFAKQVATFPHFMAHRDPCVLCSGNPSDTSDIYVAMVSMSGTGKFWKISTEGQDVAVSRPSDIAFTPYSGQSHAQKDVEMQFCELTACSCNKKPYMSYSFISCDSSGTVKTCSFEIDHIDIKVRIREIQTFNTSVGECSMISATSYSYAALADRSRTNVIIWNLASGQHEQLLTFRPHETVQHIRWKSCTSNRSLFAIALVRKVHIYVEARYDFEHDRLPWRRVKTIDLTKYTNLPISDILWTAQESLVLAAGNQLFYFGTSFPMSSGLILGLDYQSEQQMSCKITKALDLLSCCVPAFHCHFLAHLFFAHGPEPVGNLLKAFHEKLKFYVHEELFDPLLDWQTTIFNSRGDPRRDSLEENERQQELFDEETNLLLTEKISQVSIPYLDPHDKEDLLGVVGSYGSVIRHARAVDDFGLRYLFQLNFFTRPQDGKKLSHTSQLPWRDILWAYHSNSQDILIDLTTRQCGGRMLWRHAQQRGLFMWIRDINAVKAQFEIIARNEYTKTEEKDPVDCSLYYLALKKKPVLQGLWRMATWHREQSATQRMLTNNFNDARWKTAALKNAYALLGRRRIALTLTPEYAAAFFLLADHLRDAVHVIANQLNDIQLAIAVARVYEGDGGPVLKDLVQSCILQQAVSEGNKFLASWAFATLGHSDIAIRALTLPPHTLINYTLPLPLQARSVQSDDPSAIWLYRHLRDVAINSLSRNRPTLSLQEEWKLVMHSVRMYVRMGLDLIALQLVRDWRFLPLSSYTLGPKQEHSISVPVTAAVRDRDGFDGGLAAPQHINNMEADDSETADSPITQEDENKSEASPNGQAHRKKVVEEPSATSILDNFDF